MPVFRRTDDACTRPAVQSVANGLQSEQQPAKIHRATNRTRWPNDVVTNIFEYLEPQRQWLRLCGALCPPGTCTRGMQPSDTPWDAEAKSYQRFCCATTFMPATSNNLHHIIMMYMAFMKHPTRASRQSDHWTHRLAIPDVDAAVNQMCAHLQCLGGMARVESVLAASAWHTLTQGQVVTPASRAYLHNVRPHARRVCALDLECLLRGHSVNWCIAGSASDDEYEATLTEEDRAADAVMRAASHAAYLASHVRGLEEHTCRQHDAHTRAVIKEKEKEADYTMPMHTDRAPSVEVPRRRDKGKGRVVQSFVLRAEAPAFQVDLLANARGVYPDRYFEDFTPLTEKGCVRNSLACVFAATGHAIPPDIARDIPDVVRNGCDLAQLLRRCTFVLEATIPLTVVTRQRSQDRWHGFDVIEAPPGTETTPIGLCVIRMPHGDHCVNWSRNPFTGATMVDTEYWDSPAGQARARAGEKRGYVTPRVELRDAEPQASPSEQTPALPRATEGDASAVVWPVDLADDGIEAAIRLLGIAGSEPPVSMAAVAPAAVAPVTVAVPAAPLDAPAAPVPAPTAPGVAAVPAVPQQPAVVTCLTAHGAVVPPLAAQPIEPPALPPPAALQPLPRFCVSARPGTKIFNPAYWFKADDTAHGRTYAGPFTPSLAPYLSAAGDRYSDPTLTRAKVYRVVDYHGLWPPEEFLADCRTRILSRMITPPTIRGWHSIAPGVYQTFLRDNPDGAVFFREWFEEDNVHVLVDKVIEESTRQMASTVALNEHLLSGAVPVYQQHAAALSMQVPATTHLGLLWQRLQRRPFVQRCHTIYSVGCELTTYLDTANKRWVAALALVAAAVQGKRLVCAAAAGMFRLVGSMVCAAARSWCGQHTANASQCLMQFIASRRPVDAMRVDPDEVRRLVLASLRNIGGAQCVCGKRKCPDCESKQIAADDPSYDGPQPQEHGGFAMCATPCQIAVPTSGKIDDKAQYSHGLDATDSAPKVGAVLVGMACADELPYPVQPCADALTAALRGRVVCERPTAAPATAKSWENYCRSKYRRMFRQYAPEHCSFRRWLQGFPVEKQQRIAQAREDWKNGAKRMRAVVQLFTKWEKTMKRGATPRCIFPQDDLMNSFTGPFFKEVSDGLKLAWADDPNLRWGSGLDGAGLGSFFQCLCDENGCWSPANRHLIIDDDFTTFDITVGPVPHRVLHSLLSHLGIWKRLNTDECWRKMSRLRGFSRWGHKAVVCWMIMSGVSWTTVANTLVNVLAHCYALKRSGFPDPMDGGEAKIIANGDDFAAILPRKACPPALTGVERVLRELGFKPKLQLRTELDVQFNGCHATLAVDDQDRHLIVMAPTLARLGPKVGFCLDQKLATQQWMDEVVGGVQRLTRLVPALGPWVEKMASATQADHQRIDEKYRIRTGLRPCEAADHLFMRRTGMTCGDLKLFEEDVRGWSNRHAYSHPVFTALRPYK